MAGAGVTHSGVRGAAAMVHGGRRPVWGAVSLVLAKWRCITRLETRTEEFSKAASVQVGKPGLENA